MGLPCLWAVDLSISPVAALPEEIYYDVPVRAVNRSWAVVTAGLDVDTISDELRAEAAVNPRKMSNRCLFSELDFPLILFDSTKKKWPFFWGLLIEAGCLL